MGPQTNEPPPAKAARLTSAEEKAPILVDAPLGVIGTGNAMAAGGAAAKNGDASVAAEDAKLAPPAAQIARMDVSRFHTAYDTYIFDADGVLWLGAGAVDGATRLLDQLIQAGKRVLILTNNSTKSLSAYAEKCAKLGFKVAPENIVSAAAITAHELKKMRATRPEMATLPVYLMGSFELKKILEEEVGVECIGCGPDHIEDYTKETILMDVDVSRRVSAVVTSFDSHLSYPKVMKAANYLRDAAVEFIVTNEDFTFPGSVPGVVVPGAGTISTVVRAVSGREPKVMGKPHRAAFDYIRERYGDVDAARTLMIGDRCDTDVAFGSRNGLDTLMVLTGVHSLRDVDKFRAAGQPNCVPKMFTESVKDLLKP